LNVNDTSASKYPSVSGTRISRRTVIVNYVIHAHLEAFSCEQAARTDGQSALNVTEIIIAKIPY
jgi:hypothetical protein